MHQNKSNKNECKEYNKIYKVQLINQYSHHHKGMSLKRKFYDFLMDMLNNLCLMNQNKSDKNNDMEYNLIHKYLDLIFHYIPLSMGM